MHRVACSRRPRNAEEHGTGTSGAAAAPVATNRMNGSHEKAPFPCAESVPADFSRLRVRAGPRLHARTRLVYAPGREVAK